MNDGIVQYRDLRTGEIKVDTIFEFKASARKLSGSEAGAARQKVTQQ